MESSRFLFGDFELDVAQRELRRSGERIDLQPRVFDLLLYLVRNRDRAVGKDELQDSVWPGMVITETALTRAVMKARKAVGDNASKQSVIRTVHGHGYHFITSVEEPDEAQAPPQPFPSKKKPRGLPRPILATLALLVVFAALFGLWRTFAPAEPTPDMRVAVLPLSDRTDDPELAWTRLGLMSYASKSLAADGSIPVVADGAVAGLSTAMSWEGNADELAGSGLVKSLRKAYGATHVLAMELLAEGPTLRMNYALVDETGRTRHGTMVGSEAVQLANGAVQAVFGQLLGRSRLGGTDLPVSEDPFNNEAFARGMDLVLEGRCAEANPFFRLITEQEPELFAPRLELASCLRVLGETDEAELLLDQLVLEQESLENPARLGESLLVLAVLQNRTGRLNEAEANYLAARQAAEEAEDDELAARAVHNLAILEKNRGNWEKSTEYLDLAAAGYREAGREIMPGQLWSGYANLKMGQGKLAEAADYLDQALEAFRATGDKRNEAMMLNNYGYLRRMQGRLDEAEDFHLQSLAIRTEIRDRVGIGRIHSMLSVLYSARGDYEPAVESALQALAIARATNDRLFEGTSLAQLAGAERRLGMVEQARGHYAESRDVLASLQDTMRVIQVELKLAEMELDQGLPDAAEAVARDSLERARRANHVRPEIESMVLLADIELARNRENKALEAYRAAIDRVRDTSFTALERSILVKTAELQMDLGQIAECAPLVGALSLMEQNAASLKTRARHAWLSGDADLAVKNMTSARELAGDNWDDSDQSLLQAYQAK